jgi:primosomal protein N' (replication factor Y)
MNFARVALDVPLARLFDYRVPEDLEVERGDRVVVPFGARSRVGIAVERAARSAVAPERLKPLTRVLHDAPRLPPEWLDFVAFLSAYYQRPLGETLVHALPPRLRSVKPLPRAVRGAPPSPPAHGDFVSRHRPTPAQAAAIARIAAAHDGFRVFLLHGVTGSGKTEVYLHAIAAVLARGAQALVLVPEIGLTPQLEARVREAFPHTLLALLHSALDDSARTGAWLAAARGEAGIVLGTRLAVLTPLPRLGLIVVDEEHDPSFKQQEGLRYSARDAAVMRAKQAGCPALLGTATPALETWHNSLEGRYAMLSLPERAVAGAALPRVRTLDLRAEPPEHGFARAAIEAIAGRLARGEQSLVFINRRGYAPVLACDACGWAAGCARCSTRLVLHSTDRRLRCHHCGAEAAIPRACPTCGNPDLRALGRGTQRVEETLAARFPQARVLRIDRDTARRRGALARALEGVRRGEGDILVGTQLLAKGHDFPDLTLVCVLNADQALFSTDYRAAERLFATLAQVAGRAGRREQPGEVLLQTRFPEHPLFAALARHDYAGFAAAQLAERSAAGFPPFVFEAALRAEARKLAAALAFLEAARRGAPAVASVRVFDPVPHVITRRAGAERAQLLMQSTSRPALQAYLRGLSAWLQRPLTGGLRWHLDVDPIEFD